VTHSSSSGRGCGDAGQHAEPTARLQQQQEQQQQQELEQLTLACVISSIHATTDSSSTAAAAATTPSSPQRHAAQPASAAVVLKVLQQLVANGIAIKPFLSSGPEDRWGLGLYPVTAAVVNHDCNPNCSIRYVIYVTQV
jgi:hypothetical protein